LCWLCDVHASVSTDAEQGRQVSIRESDVVIADDCPPGRINSFGKPIKILEPSTGTRSKRFGRQGGMRSIQGVKKDRPSPLAAFVHER
jgi:hypothetical protein